MRIAHVLSDARLGGAGRYLLSLLAEPVWYGDDLAVALPPGELASHCQAASDGRWATHVLPIANRSFDVPSVLPLARWLRRTRPDLVHAHASLSARVAAHLSGIPAVVYTRHGSSRRASAQWGGGRFSPIRQRAERLLRDHAVAVSLSVAEELVADGVPAERVHVVPVGVSPAPYHAAAGRRSEWRARLDVKENEVVIVGTGRLVPEKDWETWIGAARAALRAPADATGTALRFFIAGEGPERDRLARACREAGLPPRTLLGFVDDVPGLLAAADMFMLVSRTEGLALALVEAMHAGLPVVASRAGGLPEAVRDGETGWLVPPGDAGAAAAAIVRLAGDRGLRQAMGRAGRERAGQEYSAARMAARVRELYASLLGSRIP